MFGLLILGFWVATLGGAFYLARRLVIASERRSGSPSETRELRDRVVILEETIETMRRDMDRIDSGMEFTTKLLEGRVGQSRPPETK